MPFQRLLVFIANFICLFTVNGNNTNNDNNLHSKLVSVQNYIKETPNEPELHLHEGYIYHQLSNLEKESINDISSYSKNAELSYKKCINLNPNEVNCIVNLGKLLYDRFERNGVLENESNKKILVDIFHRAIKVSPPNHLQSRVNLGVNLHNMRRYNEAVKVYKEALPHHKDSLDLLYNYAISLTEMGDISEAIKVYHAAVDVEPTFVKSWLNIGVIHHKHGLLADAVWNYHHAIKVLLMNHYSNESLDNATDFTVNCPFDMVYNLLDLSENEVICDYGDNLYVKLVDEENSDDSVRLLVILLNNLGQAMLQQGRVQDSIHQHFSAAFVIHRIINKKINLVGSNQTIKWWSLLLESSVLIFKAAKAGCEWSVWNMIDILVQKINQYQFVNGLESSLLPFDTLSLPISPLWKKKVAMRHALQLSSSSNDEVFTNLSQYGSKTRIGFLSYDFKNHPTSHLTEGIFYWYNQSFSHKIEIAAYSYGDDDNSTYRNNIKHHLGGCYMQDGGDFFDISSMGHHSAINLIRNDKPHVVYDMQGFTLGGRNELTAYRISPIQVSYLVFPGTSGAMYIDYIVGDAYVTPPEHMNLYTEKLAIMPRSYQVNYYERHLNDLLKQIYHYDEKTLNNMLMNKQTLSNYQEHLVSIHRGSKQWKDFRMREGLPPSPNIFVFANFNKQDKLEPNAFRIWMQIMIMVPNSLLWLLEPVYLYSKDYIENKILDMAEAEGVHRSRIIFAKRVDKAQHLQRGIVADLFLDSIYYGAHSTATDALISGLPVLTISGDSFSSRVAISLLNSISEEIATLLISYTIKEYIEMAVFLATKRTKSGDYLATKVKFEIQKAISNCDLFDGEGYMHDLEQMSKALWNIRQTMGSNSMHLIM